MVGRLGLRASSCLYWRGHRLRSLFDGINPLKATRRGDDLNRCGDTVGFCACRISRCFFCSGFRYNYLVFAGFVQCFGFQRPDWFFCAESFFFCSPLIANSFEKSGVWRDRCYHISHCGHCWNGYRRLLRRAKHWRAEAGACISPNKTWAGLIGGTIAAGLVGLLFFYTLALGGKDIAVLDVFGHEAAAAFAASCLIAPLAQSGDLMESWIKRRRGVKDSGNLIPGHGGILDRVDGYLTAAPAIAVIAIMHKEGGVVWP